jgi:hypothetical protein
VSKFLFLLLISLSQSAFGQAVHVIQVQRPYSKYEDRSFECSFKISNKTIIEYCKANGKPECINFLSSQFLPDSSYRINLNVYTEKETIVYEQSTQFIGRYLINPSGEIVLQGKHPFTSNSIIIKEKKYKHYTCTLGYRFELKSNYLSDSSRGNKFIAICDGDCELSK